MAKYDVSVRESRSYEVLVNAADRQAATTAAIALLENGSREPDHRYLERDILDVTPA